MDPPGHTGSQTAVIVYQLFREARRRGLSEDDLSAVTGLRPAEVADADRRIDAATLFHVWETLMRRLRDPGLPVTAARNAQTDPRSALSLLVEASATVGEAFAHATRYGSAWSTIYALRVQPWRDGGIVVSLDGLGVDRLGERCEAEYTVTEIVLMLRAYTGGSGHPTQVRFAHPAPERTGAHDRLFGGALRFGAPRTEITIAAPTLALRLRTARPGLAAILAARLDELAARNTRPCGFAPQVREAVLARLGREPVTAASTARQLVVSEADPAPPARRRGHQPAPRTRPDPVRARPGVTARGPSRGEGGRLGAGVRERPVAAPRVPAVDRHDAARSIGVTGRAPGGPDALCDSVQRQGPTLRPMPRSTTVPSDTGRPACRFWYATLLRFSQSRSGQS
jgi:hypothetical protein